MQRITTLDLHTEGEPLRIITSGIDLPPGDNIIARRAFAHANHDEVRVASGSGNSCHEFWICPDL